MPLVYCSWCAVPFEIPRVWFIHRWIELLIVITLIGSSPLQNVIFRKPLVVLISAWIIIALISSLLGPDIHKSFIGNFYRKDGLVTWLHLLSLSIWISYYWQPVYTQQLVTAIAYANTLVVAKALIEGFQIHILGDPWVTDWEGLVSSTFGQPNFLAGYLAVTIPIIWYLWKLQSHKRWLFLIFAQALVIILTGSFGSFLTLGVWGLIVLWQEQPRLGKWATVLTLVAAMFIYRLEFTGEQLYQPEGRARIFSILWQAVLQKPFLGWGVANVDYAFENSSSILRYDQEVYVDKAHTHFLESLVTTGFVGFIFYLSILMFCGFIIWSRMHHTHGLRRYWLACLLTTWVLFVFHSQTNIISIAEELLWWLILGLTLSSAQRSVSHHLDTEASAT